MLYPVVIVISQAIASTPVGKIDLTILRPCEPNGPADADVIVCGRQGDQSSRYRIPPPSRPETELRRAETQLGGNASLSAETERVEIGGVPSNRLMVRLKFRF